MLHRTFMLDCSDVGKVDANPSSMGRVLSLSALGPTVHKRSMSGARSVSVYTDSAYQITTSTGSHIVCSWGKAALLFEFILSVRSGTSYAQLWITISDNADTGSGNLLSSELQGSCEVNHETIQLHTTVESYQYFEWEVDRTRKSVDSSRELIRQNGIRVEEFSAGSC